jgi:hypothetical protein
MWGPVGAGDRGPWVGVLGWSVWLCVQDWTCVQFCRHLPSKSLSQLEREIHGQFGRFESGSGGLTLSGRLSLFFRGIYFWVVTKVWVWRRQRRMRGKYGGGFTWGVGYACQKSFPWRASSFRPDDDNRVTTTNVFAIAAPERRF